MNKIGGREALRRRIEELARGETEQVADPNLLARTTLEAKATDLRLKLDQAARNIMEVENPSLIKALEKRYSEDARELAATEAEIAKLQPPSDQHATDIDSEVEAALVLFDEIERLAEMPMANEAINAMLERIDLRIGLYFEDTMKGKRPVRKVANGIIALGDFPLPVPPYGEPRMLPTAALDAGLQRRLAAELEAAPAKRGRSPPQSNLRDAAVTITAIPATFQKSRRVAATMFRWILPTRPPMAMDVTIGPPGRSPKGLFRLVHNCH